MSHDGLEVNDSASFASSEWRVQRVAWAAMLVVVVAALSGLFGPGPLSHETVASDDGRLRADYLRFARFGSPSALNIIADPDLATGGLLELRVSRDWLERMQVENVLPPPSDVTIAGSELVYAFPVVEPGRRIFVTFEVTPDAIGTASASLGAAAADVEFAQLVYP